MPIYVIVLIFYMNLITSPIVFAASGFSLVTNSESSSPWTLGEKMPTARTELMAESIDSKIYVLGGVDYGKGLQLDVVEIYDTDTEKWNITAKPLPQAIDHSAAVSFKGKIYVVGGFLDGKVPTDKLFIYNPAKNEWKEGKSLPSARGALTAQFMNGILYAVGGLNASQIPVNTNEGYDPETNTWTKKKPMPTARHHLSSAVVDGKLYAIGGRILGNGVPSEDLHETLTNFNRNEMYDPKTDAWVVKEPMKDKRSGFAATSANGKIYVFGGEGVKKTLNTVESYDPATNKWTIEQPMPTKRIGLDAVTVDSKIYVIGGQIYSPESGLVALDINGILDLNND